jgi:glucose/arabinose dehydrogenase
VVLVGACLFGLVVYVRPRNTSKLPPRFAAPVSLPSDNPFAGNWTTAEAFPGVVFERPLTIVQIDPTRFLVAQQGGMLLIVTGGAKPHAEPFLNLAAKVVDKGEAGLVGVVIHPEFGSGSLPQSRYFYVYYVARVGDKMYDRVSRFETDATHSQADATSEFVLIDQLDRDTDHNAGQLQFGPDSFLYVGIGDEGGVADQFGNAQHLDKNLFSGILRIDVDCQVPARSHPIVRQPQTGRTQGYCIPNDNPFDGVPGALQEFWAVGFRNPWRFSFDGSKLWGADVGQDRREAIFVATPGSNHQWSYREGTISFTESPLHGQPPTPPIGVEETPVFDYPHTNGNGAVIGGYVYRGAQFPELNGKYLFGDYNSGRIWSLEVPALTGSAGVPKLDTLMRLPQDQRVVAFGRDRQGELFLCVFGRRSTILRLKRAI